MKKLLGLVAIAATAATALTACGGEAVKPNVVVVTAEGSINDGTFNQGAFNGAKAANLMYGTVTEGYYEAKTGDAAALATAIQNQLDNGAETVILPGFTHGTKQLDDMSKLAKNADKKFVLIDANGYCGDVTAADECGFEYLGAHKNIATATYKIEEVAYLTGFMTQLHLQSTQNEVKYGLWGGMAFPSVYSFMVGFRQGAEDAADLNAAKKATFLAPKTGATAADYYSGDFNSGSGKALADNYLGQGADILLPVAGPQTKDAIDAIKGKSGSTAKVIGVDVDAKGLYKSDADYILTSIMKNIAKTVADVLQPVYGFGGKNYFGEGYEGTLLNGGIGFTKITGFDTNNADYKTAYDNVNNTDATAHDGNTTIKSCSTVYSPKGCN